MVESERWLQYDRRKFQLETELTRAAKVKFEHDEEIFGAEETTDNVMPPHGDVGFVDVCDFEGRGLMVDTLTGSSGVSRLRFSGQVGRRAFLDICRQHHKEQGIFLRALVGPIGVWNGNPACLLQVMAAEVPFLSATHICQAEQLKSESTIQDGVHCVLPLDEVSRSVNQGLSTNYARRLQGSVVRVMVNEIMRGESNSGTFEQSPEFSGSFVSSSCAMVHDLFFGSPGLLSWGPRDPAAGVAGGLLWQISNDRHFRNPASLIHTQEFVGTHERGNSRSFRFGTAENGTGQGLDRARDQAVKWADERVQEGVHWAKRSQHQDAIEFYDVALGLVPEHKDALIAKGASLANLKKFSDAVEYFDRALKESPSNKNAMHYREMAANAMQKITNVNPEEKTPPKRREEHHQSRRSRPSPGAHDRDHSAERRRRAKLELEKIKQDKASEKKLRDTLQSSAAGQFGMVIDLRGGRAGPALPPKNVDRTQDELKRLKKEKKENKRLKKERKKEKKRMKKERKKSKKKKQTSSSDSSDSGSDSNRMIDVD